MACIATALIIGFILGWFSRIISEREKRLYQKRESRASSRLYSGKWGE